jgi:hypothetical protein
VTRKEYHRDIGVLGDFQEFAKGPLELQIADIVARQYRCEASPFEQLSDCRCVPGRVWEHCGVLVGSVANNEGNALISDRS